MSGSLVGARRIRREQTGRTHDRLPLTRLRDFVSRETVAGVLLLAAAALALIWANSRGGRPTPTCPHGWSGRPRCTWT
ncbi:hypothetical protein [Tessaracoccus coleopterorum]|uniref:hypothetical protein n=1 Tax=Tessaracoccus coleopterorum TaxID=2714950 RepID=UPI001E355065|nr:hypothetical protein [Tessaracoccus coleopterorum]